MKASIRTKNLAGLAARLAARYLPQAEQQAAGAAALALAGEIEAETGVAPELAGPPDRPMVRIADPAVIARMAGSPTREAEPLLDGARLAFARTHPSARRRP